MSRTFNRKLYRKRRWIKCLKWKKLAKTRRSMWLLTLMRSLKRLLKLFRTARKRDRGRGRSLRTKMILRMTKMECLILIFMTINWIKVSLRLFQLMQVYITIEGWWQLLRVLLGGELAESRWIGPWLEVLSSRLSSRTTLWKPPIFTSNLIKRVTCMRTDFTRRQVSTRLNSTKTKTLTIRRWRATPMRTLESTMAQVLLKKKMLTCRNN
jgi:hypothetical protein